MGNQPSSETPPDDATATSPTQYPSHLRTTHDVRLSTPPTGDVFLGFDGAPTREVRPVFSALMAQAKAARTSSTSNVKPVKLFVAANDDDFLWERNALHKDVWPFLRRFARVLGVDFDVVDCPWNMPDSSDAIDIEHTNRLLSDCLESSFGPAFFCLLGDKYGSTTLPSSIPARDFSILLSAATDPSLLETWYALDSNSNTYTLSPISDVLGSSTGVALEKWSVFVKPRLLNLLVEAAGSLEQGNDTRKRIQTNGVDYYVDLVTESGSGVGVDRITCFQRTFTKQAPTATSGSKEALPSYLEPRYFDTTGNTQPSLDTTSAKRALVSKIKPKRSYSVPWSPITGFNPSTEKAHASYLKTFCDDTARILAESMLRHYTSAVAKAASGTTALAVELEEQEKVVQTLLGAAGGEFVGREEVLDKLVSFVGDWEGLEGVCVLYGPAGIGKSAVLAKLNNIIPNTVSPTPLVISRFVGKTHTSSNIHSLLSSICRQISHLYGMDDLRARITEELEAVTEDGVVADVVLQDELFELLENWPPTSMSGLKLGIRIGMGLATSEVPLVLIIDGLYDLTNEADALNIDWLPALLPENVKVIISANPVSKKQSLFLSLCSKFPSVTPQQQQDMISNISNAMYLELGPLSSREVDRYVTKLIAASKRTLTSEQMTLLTTKAQASRVPLYISTAFQLCASKWTGMTDYSVAKRALQSESVSGILEDALEQLEKQFGVLLVSRICAFITAARNGLSLGELTDVVSLEWDVVSEVFEGKDVVVRRLNSVLVEQVLWELQGCLAKKRVGAGGLEAYFWSSSVFKSVAAERYLYLTDRLVATHRSLANYWRDKKVKEAAGTGAPATETKSSNGRDKATTVVKTFGFNQTLLILGKPNERRISSVVWHLLNCGTSGATEAVKTLQSISFLGAAIDAGLLDEILECFKFALENLGVSIYSAQLTEYYRFLIVNYNTLSKSPRQLIPLAANLYTTSVVSGDVRSWIKSKAPELNWAEWINRPTSRGEPVALLRSDDPSQELTVTSRDTYANLVAVAGIRNSDGASTLRLFEVNFKSALSVLPEERGRVIGTATLGITNEEEGLPLVCCFSRDGKTIAVASRSILFLDTANLSTVGHIEDPSLPEGDLITAMAWTKDDGCVVTASDGSDPGRIVLWDALSFQLLRVIKSQYPRQPICGAYSTLGFWDEYRELFILLDVDELAADAESGLFLQYIPTKSHSDPPADGCARFALAHKSTYVLVATDEGTGYTLIDYRAKRAVAKVDIEIDTVRYVSLSSDGTRIAIIPQDGKVIHILGLNESLESVKEGELPAFVHMGTILGSDVEQPVCLFSRNRMTILTDGELSGETQVWAMNDLGDHSTVRYYSLLPALSQGLSPIMSGATNNIGWAVTENWTDVSLSDVKGKQKVRCYDMSMEGAPDKYSYPKPAFFKDVVVGIDSHPSKPFTVVVTDQGYLSVLYNDSISADLRGWIKGLWSSKKVEDGLIATYNLCRDPQITSPTCVTFIKANLTAGQQQAQPKNAAQVEYLSFLTGHEDGSVHMWDWNTQSEDITHMKSLKLKYGRISALVPANAGIGSRNVAIVVDDSTVALWDGVSKDLASVSVLVTPGSAPVPGTVGSDRGSFSSVQRRSASSSVWSTQGLGDPNMSRSTVVAFSNYSEQVLATGEPNGTATIWFLENKTKRALLTHPERVFSNVAVLAMGWSSDDGALASLTEDKRIAIHGVDSGELIWIHDLWMIAPPLKVASFVTGARHLCAVDVYGSFTAVNLHGKWPFSKASNKTRLGALKNAITSSASKISHMINSSGDGEDFHPLATAGLNLDAQELEKFEIRAWDSEINNQLTQNRKEANTRSSDSWQYTTGSGSHGHVALLKLDSGLPRGTYEVICDLEIPETFGSLRRVSQSGLHLKFVCGIAEGHVQNYRSSVDPELEVVRGFTRFFPIDEQKQLAGMGPVSLRLGYLKTLCNLNTAYVDLKRIPGEGEVFKLGAVHFVPADPALYSPFYQHPAELNNAFDLIAQKFKEFEARHRRRSSVLNTVISERMSSQASVQDLKEALMKAQHEFVDSVEEPPARPEIPKGEAPAPMMTSLTSRLSMLPKNLGALLGTAGGPPASMEQIQREMEAARVKANEEARRLELEEEQLMLAQQREREARALREEYERNAKEKIARMVKGEREPVPVPAAAISQEEYVDEVDDVYENAEVEQEQIIEMEDLDQDVYEAAESNVQYADNSVVEAAEPVIERPFSFNESVAEKPTYSSYAEREIDLGDDAVVAAEETYVQSVVVNAVSVADVYDAPVESDVNILKDAEEAREDEDDTPYIESVVSNAVSYENTYVAPVDDELFGSEEIEQTAGVASEEMEETAVVVAEETEQTTILDEPADEFAEVQTREILQETTYTEDVDAEQATSTEVPAYMADEQVLDDVDEPESHEETNEVAVQDVIYAEELSAESVEEPVHIDEAADVEVADVEAAHVEVVDEAIADDEPVADAADDIADDEPVADAADDIADDEPVADAADEELANYDELVVERAESSEEVIEQAYQSVEETVSAEFEEPLQEREVLTVVPTGEFAAAIEAEFENNEVDEPVYDIDEGVVESNFAEVVEGETMEPVYDEAVNTSYESLEEPDADVPETDDTLDTTIEPTDVIPVETAFEYADVSAVQAVEQEEFVIEASQEKVQDSEAFAQEPEFAEVENAQNMVDVSAVDDFVPSSNQDIYNFEPATDDVDVEASIVVPESQPSLDIEGQGNQSFDYGDYGADDVADNVHEAEEYVESTAVEPSVAHSFEDDEVDSEAVEQSEFKIEESYEAEGENHTVEEPAVDFYEQVQEVPVAQVEQSFDFGDYGVEENEEDVEVISDEKVEAENLKTEVVEDIDDTDFMDSYGVEEENQDDSAQDISTEDYLSTVVNGDEKTEDFRVDDFMSDVFKGTGETFSMEFGSDFKVSDAVSSDVTGEEESEKAKEEI